MSNIQERYRPQPIGVNAVAKLQINAIAGFLAATSGFVTVVDGSGVTIIATTPVTAGVYTPMPFLTGPSRAGATPSSDSGKTIVTLSGGASGTLGVA